MRYRKASTTDYIFFLGVFLFLAIATLVGVYIYDQISPFLIQQFGSGEATTALNATRQVYDLMDFIFMFLYIIMMLLPVIMSIFVKNHPIFLVINIILLLVYILVTPAISNAMREFWNTPQFSQYAFGGTAETTFPIMSSVFQYLPILSCMFGLVLSIAMFGKGDTI